MIPQNTPKLNHYLYETNSAINELKGLTALANIWCCVVQKQTWGSDSHVLTGDEESRCEGEEKMAPVSGSLLGIDSWFLYIEGLSLTQVPKVFVKYEVHHRIGACLLDVPRQILLLTSGRLIWIVITHNSLESKSKCFKQCPIMFCGWMAWALQHGWALPEASQIHSMLDLVCIFVPFSF